MLLAEITYFPQEIRRHPAWALMMIMVTLATYAALRGRSVPQPSSSCGNAAEWNTRGYTSAQVHGSIA